MVQLTNGTVKHTIPSNYSEGKHGAEVTLTWTAAEGEAHDAIVAFAQHVAQVARRTAINMIVGSATEAGPPAGLPAAPPPMVAPSPLPATPAPTPVGLPAVVPPPAPAPTIPTPPVPVAPAPLPAAVTTAAPTELPWDDRTVTEMLTRAAARLAPVHGDAAPQKLRELIARFLPEGSPPKAGAIPAEHRALFVQHLEALQ